MPSSLPSSNLINGRFISNLFPIPATSPLHPGRPAPRFGLLEVQTGQWRSLASQGDRLLVLAFTRIFTERHYCPLCYPHIQALNLAYPQFQQRGAEVWMITSTDEAQSQQIAADLNLQMPLLSDPSCQVFRQYRLGQALGAPLPAQFILDRQGIIQFRHLFSFLHSNASVEQLLAVIDRLS